MNKLFVYGIFLSEANRARYGMHLPRYATVKGYATFGHDIVEARRVKNPDACLTGLVVDIDPEQWEELDKLEAGYKRIRIRTVQGIEAYMYVGK